MKKQPYPCWRCGSSFHDSMDCGVSLADIRSGQVKPYIPKKDWDRIRLGLKYGEPSKKPAARRLTKPRRKK